MRNGVVAIPLSVVVAPSSNQRVANTTRPQNPMGPSFHMPTSWKVVSFPMWGARQSRLMRERFPSFAAFVSGGRLGRFPMFQRSEQSRLQLGREAKKPISSQSEEKPKFPGSGIVLSLGFRLGGLSCSRRQGSQKEAPANSLRCSARRAGREARHGHPHQKAQQQDQEKGGGAASHLTLAVPFREGGGSCCHRCPQSPLGCRDSRRLFLFGFSPTLPPGFRFRLSPCRPSLFLAYTSSCRNSRRSRAAALRRSSSRRSAASSGFR